MSKRNLIIFIIGLFVVGGISAALIYVKVYNKPHRNIEREAVDHSMTADALFAELAEDQEAANKKYTTEDVLEVQGVVMEKISLGDTVYVLNIGTSPTGDNLINVKLHGKYVSEPDYKAQYTKLSEGDPVYVKGKFTGSDLEDLIIIQAYKVSLNNGFIIDKAS